MPLDPLFYKNAPKAAAPPAPFGAVFLTQGGGVPCAPAQFVYSSFERPFCQGITPKNFACGGNTPRTPARVLYPRAPASRSARVRRRAPLLGGRLACRAIAPYHVVKMRDARSLRVFNENYPLPRSFSLRVVGVTPPHPQATALFLFLAFILSRNCAEKFSRHSPLKFSRP